jgi:hypothetical protein
VYAICHTWGKKSSANHLRGFGSLGFPLILTLGFFLPAGLGEEDLGEEDRFLPLFPTAS